MNKHEIFFTRRSLMHPQNKGNFFFNLYIQFFDFRDLFASYVTRVQNFQRSIPQDSLKR